ncbi:MAG: hypothetical protein GX589_03310 [Deltaproteobacteria bacterium]|nr:hypothetical protein [Deltaproteobacteria bacterium]
MSFVQLLNLPRLDVRTVDRLLRRESVERSVAWLKIAIVALICFLLVLTVRNVIEELLVGSSAVYSLKNDIRSRLKALPEEHSFTAPKSDYAHLADEAVFGKIGFTQPTPYATPPIAAKKVSTLTLIGTFVSEDEGSYAIIDDKKSQEVFEVGDLILNEAKVLRIFEDRVEIERNGQREILQIDETPGGGGGETVSDSIVVDEGEIDRALENLPLLLTQARAVPYFKDGQSVGLRLFAIKSGSLFEKIGLMNGDILKTVNGNSLGDITQAVKLFEKLKEQRMITVELERQREEKTLRYQIR